MKYFKPCKNLFKTLAALVCVILAAAVFLFALPACADDNGGETTPPGQNGQVGGNNTGSSDTEESGNGDNTNPSETEEPMDEISKNEYEAYLSMYYGRADLSENATLNMGATYETSTDGGMGSTYKKITQTNTVAYLKDGSDLYGNNVIECTYEAEEGQTSTPPYKYSLLTYLRNGEISSVRHGMDSNIDWGQTAKGNPEILKNEFWNELEYDGFDEEGVRAPQFSVMKRFTDLATIFIFSAEDANRQTYVTSLNSKLPYVFLQTSFINTFVSADTFDFTVKCFKNENRIKGQWSFASTYADAYGNGNVNTEVTLSFDLNVNADNVAEDFDQTDGLIPDSSLRYIDTDADFSSLPQQIKEGADLSFEMRGTGVVEYIPDSSNNVGALCICGTYDGQEIIRKYGSSEYKGLLLVIGMLSEPNNDSFVFGGYSETIASDLEYFGLLSDASEYDPAKLEISEIVVYCAPEYYTYDPSSSERGDGFYFPPDATKYEFESYAYIYY